MRDSFGGILGVNLGEGNCKSKIVARQWGVDFCHETSRCLAGPSGFGTAQKVDFGVFGGCGGSSEFSLDFLGLFSLGLDFLGLFSPRNFFGVCLSFVDWENEFSEKARYP